MNRYFRAAITLLIFIVIFSLSQIASATLFQYMARWGVGLSTGVGYMLCYVAAMLLVIALLRLYERVSGVVSDSVKCGERGFNPILLLRGFIILVAASVVMLPLSYVMPNDDRLLPDSGWTLFTVALLAPIFEEYLFRGKLYNLLGSSLNPSLAATLSALTFGIVHLQPIVIIEGFVAGLIFSYFYIKCRSLIAPILLHVFNNTVAYALMTITYQDKKLDEFMTNDIAYLIVYIASAIILIISLIRIFAKFRAENRRLQLLAKE